MILDEVIRDCITKLTENAFSNFEVLDFLNNIVLFNLILKYSACIRSRQIVFKFGICISHQTLLKIFCPLYFIVLLSVC